MKKTILLILLSSIMLQGCIQTAFVAGAAAGASIVNDRRSVKTIYQDGEITRKADNLIYADKELYSRTHIVVSSFNHLVLITGQAPTEELRDKAVDIIKGIPNIKRIYNEVQIAAPSSALTRSSDAWMTTKIRTQLLITKDLSSGQLKVVTENGSAYLLGIVTPREGDLAADVARQVPGVQRVVKLFEYVNLDNHNS